MSKEAIGVCLLLAVGLPLLAAPILAILGRGLRGKVGWLALALPLLSAVSIAYLSVSLQLPGSRTVEWAWAPAMGVNFSFLLDGLSLFFALVVSVVGFLVVFYAIHYLGEEFEHHGRFYSYLVIFMAAMLGTVLSNNLLLMFIFWELTGIASFLLIGFLHQEESSRVGARQALLVTSFTGLVMLVGIIFIYVATGTFNVDEIARKGFSISHDSVWLTWALVFVVVGAFGKSAQFPLHFWLPNAMAAPTPVSAYLHSATMVKLGVYLCARIYPLFVENDLWPYILGILPLTTMALGAVLALLSHDLKAILAFSTVSQLGFLISYYGLGPLDGVEYDYLHILNHVLYKGSLFMVVGIVAHSCGIRDIRDLGGLFRSLPLLGLTTLAATATMAGLPGTTGFLSKEMMLKEVFESLRTYPMLGIYGTFCVVITSIVKIAFSARIFVNIFLGSQPDAIKAQFHGPSLALQIPPAVLASCALLFGLWPGLLNGPFASLAVDGLNRPGHLTLWHGFTRELVASSILVMLGAGLYWGGQKLRWRWDEIPRWLQFDRFFEAGLVSFQSQAKRITRVLRSDRPTDYLPITFGFVVLVLGGFLAWALFAESRIKGVLYEADWEAPDLLRTFVASLIALAVAGVVVLTRWTTQLISLSVAGFLICFYFVLYRAPDLALTQILVEVVTLFIILILLGRFPRSAEVGETQNGDGTGRKATNIIIAAGVGMTMTLAVLLVTAAPHRENLGVFFLQQTVPLAEGSNAVNTILIDFRGFDTLGEIAVLFIAMLGALGLLMRYKRSNSEYQEGALMKTGFGTDDRREGDP